MIALNNVYENSVVLINGSVNELYLMLRYTNTCMYTV